MGSSKKFEYEAIDSSRTSTLFAVYDTQKPWCADVSSPLTKFTKSKKEIHCESTTMETGCLDLCYNAHCGAKVEGGCGKEKAFDDCAKCCDNNYNNPAGCFRRPWLKLDLTCLLRHSVIAPRTAGN